MSVRSYIACLFFGAGAACWLGLLFTVALIFTGHDHWGAFYALLWPGLLFLVLGFMLSQEQS